MNRRRILSPPLANFAFILLCGSALAACATGPRPSPIAASRPAGSASPLRGTMKPYQVKGVWYYPAEQPNYDEKGTASWYGEQFHNRYTANGEVFDMDRLSAAHKTLPLPSIVEVKNLDNGRTMQVRVNDRGPFVDGRIIDLSRAAAEELGFRGAGVARVRVRYVGPAGKATPFDKPVRYAVAPPPLRPPEPAPVAAPVYAAATYKPLPPVDSAPLPPLNFDAPPPAPVYAVARAYRIQAGAFANLSNAERAAAALRSAGETVIEPIQRGEATLYRVVLNGPADEAGALALREQAAAFGFPDAQVLKPF